MELVCDRCREPLRLSEDELWDECEKCPVGLAVEMALKKERTTTAAEILLEAAGVILEQRKDGAKLLDRIKGRLKNECGLLWDEENGIRLEGDGETI